MSGSRPFHVAAWNLAVDAVTVEVLTALGERGVQAVLLKGPSVTRLLYEPGERSYVDTDLLVEPRAFGEAQGALASLGFIREEAVGERSIEHGEAWSRGMAMVDLHRRLWGVEAPDEEAWRVLAAETEVLRLGPIEVRALREAAVALGIALHAVQHGTQVGQTRRDLERALATLSLDVWRDAAVLARRLSAEPAFQAGVRALPEGRDLLVQLALAPTSSVETVLRETLDPEAAGQALLVERLVATSRFGRVTLLARLLVPSRAYMRRFHAPLARRGTAGLVAAYVRRYALLARRLIPAVREWRRARRSAASIRP